LVAAVAILCSAVIVLATILCLGTALREITRQKARIGEGQCLPQGGLSKVQPLPGVLPVWIWCH